MAFTKIVDADLLNKGVIGLPDQPGLSTAAMQNKLEETTRGVVIPKHNALIDELEADTAATSLGATAVTGRTSSPNVQAVMEKLSTDLKTVEDGMAEAIADAHTHDNKALLDTYTQTETDLADAVTKKHEHSNKALLDSYTQTEVDIADSVSKKHSHSNKALLDTYTQSETDLADAVSKKHAHSNKALLDTYSQSESDLADAVSKKHSHANKTVLDDLSDNGGALNYKGNPIGGGSVNNAYKSVKVTSGVDDTTISASGEDTFELHAGNNVTLSVDTTSTPKKITVNSTGGGGGTTYQAGDGIDISGDTIALDYGMLTGSNLTKPVVGKDIADALDGKADTSDIPANLSDLADDSTHRLVTDAEKAAWDAKVSESLLKDTVGWVGKNKLPYPFKQGSSSNRGIDFTDNGDGTLTLDGTQNDASNNAVYQMHGAWNTTTLILPAGQYRITTGTNNNDVIIGVSYSNQFLGATNNGVLEVNAPNGISYITCEVKKGAPQITNELVKPMIRKADISDSTYEPYHKSVEDWGYTREEAKANGAYNLMPINAKSGTVHGATLTVSDSGITYVGTTSETGWIWLNSATNSDTPNILMKKGTYKFSLGGTISDSPIFNINDGAGGNVYFNGRSSDEIEITFANDTYIRYGLYAGTANVSVNISIKPMISIEGGDYVPYAMTNRELTDSKMSYKDNGVLGAKNLMHYPYNGAKSSVDVTLTVDDDGVINLNGTQGSSAQGQYFLSKRDKYDFQLPAGTYILSGENTSNDVWLDVGVNNVTGNASQGSTTLGQAKGKEFRFTLTKLSDVQIILFIEKSKTFSNTKIYPMIRLASDTDDTYVPHAMTNRELTEKVQSIQTVGTIVANSSLNDYYKTGDYYSNTGSDTATLSDKPSDLAGAFRLSVICGNYPLGEGSNDVNVPVTQKIELVNGATPAIYMRQKNGGTGTYGSWYKFTGTVVS